MTPAEPSSSTSAPRPAGLAERQAALARFLVGAGPLPAGFDADGAAVAARSLDAKRAGEIADALPALASLLGPDFRREAREWLPGRPRLSPARQATDFALHLAATRELPEAMLRTLAVRVAADRRWRWRTRVDLGYRYAVLWGSPRRVRRVTLHRARARGGVTPH